MPERSLPFETRKEGGVLPALVQAHRLQQRQGQGRRLEDMTVFCSERRENAGVGLGVSPGRLPERRIRLGLGGRNRTLEASDAVMWVVMTGYGNC